MQKNKFPASAFILTGGKSERFGSPKWRSKIKGKTILDRLWNACKNFEHRYVIGKKKPDDMDKPFISDKLEFVAPINGLYTALEHAKTDWSLLIACDLPLVDNDLLENLWNTQDEKDDVIVPYSNNKHQVTCAFYHKRVLPVILSAVQTRNYNLVKLLGKMNSSVIRFDDDIRFWNMNTKQDLKSIINYCT